MSTVGVWSPIALDVLEVKGVQVGPPQMERLIGDSTTSYRILRGKGVQGEGVFLGNPKDSVWEDWGEP